MNQSSSRYYGCVSLLPINDMPKSSYTYICSEDTHPRLATAPNMIMTLYLIIWLGSIGFVGVKVLTQRVSSVVPRAAYSYAYTL